MIPARTFEECMRSIGVDPASVPRHRSSLPPVALERAPHGPGVYPLDEGDHSNLHRVSIINGLTNKNNVNNGYTPDGGTFVPPIGCASDELPAAAIFQEVTTNRLAPSLATQDDEPNSPAQPSGEEEAIGVEGDHARTPIMPAPFYLKVDLFDNGAGKPGKKKGNRYKVKIHFCMEDGGDMYSFMGAFHPVARGFRNNVPVGFENDPFYVEIDHTLDKANLGETRWIIKPAGAKFKDADNKVMIYTAAVVFWDPEEEHPTILLKLQGWEQEITLDKRPRGGPNNNLLAYGIWLNPEMQEEREVYENKRGGHTLMETMRLQQMGLK